MPQTNQLAGLNTLNGRNPEHPVNPVFIERWSPRAFSSDLMPLADLKTILEAARWAPSAFNIQPWRFIYALRDDDQWQDFIDLLDPFNADWAKNASAIIFVISDTLATNQETGEKKPSGTHSFDAGAAWAQLALQATMLSYQAHAMAGIQYKKIKQQLKVPDHFQVEVAIAIGRQASPALLTETLRERETPSSRLPLSEIAFSGSFPEETID